MARKQTRRNYYRNGAAGRPARTLSRVKSAARIIGGLSLLAATSFAFVFGYDYLTQCRYFSAREIRVTGINLVSAESVLQQAHLETGINILSVNLALARKRLLAHPWIAEAEISRDLPDSMEIRIQEHRPVAVLDLGRKFLLDESGRIFKEMSADDPKGLPLISGLEFSDINLPGDRGSVPFQSVMEVLRLSRRSTSPIPIASIRRIAVDRQLGLTLEAELDRPKIIKIGYNGYADKLDRLQKVIRFFARDGRLQDFESIDLNHPSRIVVTPVKHTVSERKEEEV